MRLEAASGAQRMLELLAAGRPGSAAHTPWPHATASHSSPLAPPFHTAPPKGAQPLVSSMMAAVLSLQAQGSGFDASTATEGPLPAAGIDGSTPTPAMDEPDAAEDATDVDAVGENDLSADAVYETEGSDEVDLADEVEDVEEVENSAATDADDPADAGVWDDEELEALNPAPASGSLIAAQLAATSLTTRALNG